MIFLVSTTDIIQVVTGSAVSTIKVHASWMDYSAGAVSLGNTNTAITAATTTTIVGSPAAGSQRNVKTLEIFNDSPDSCQITVQVTNPSGTSQMYTVDLDPLYGIQYTDGAGFSIAPITPTNTPGFDDILSGTNLSASMVIGSGAELTPAGTGVIEATGLATPSAPITTDGNSPTHAGMLLLSQPGNESAIWADPQVQGLYAVGSFINSPPSYSAPTTIQPVSIGGSDYNGATPALQDLKVDSSGQIYVGNFPSFAFTHYGSPAVQALDVYVVNPISVSFPSSMPVTQSTSPWVVSLASTIVTGSVAVTGTFWQATQPVSGTVAISNFPASQAVTGTFWPTTQPVSNAALSELSFTSSGSPAVEALNVYVVNTTSAEVPAASGGATPKGFHIANNTVQAIKATFGQIYGYYLDNTANAATTYFQFFNIASGSVSLGSSVALFTIPVPAGSAANLSISPGWAFTTAMSFAATTTYNGNTFAASPVDCTIAFN